MEGRTPSRSSRRYCKPNSVVRLSEVAYPKFDRKYMQHPLFAIGLPHGYEWLIILVLAVLFFGADKLPKLARGLGKSLGEFKKAKEEFEKEVHAAASEPDVKPVTDQNKIGGNLPQPVTPTPVNTATSVDELTKKS